MAEQIEFSKSLISILKFGMVTVMAFSMPIADFISVYPESTEPIKDIYSLLLKFIMGQLIDDINAQAKNAGRKLQDNYRFAFIHDRTNYDGALLAAFNFMKDDETFEGRHHFATIAPLGWEDCIPLQAADLVAYESFKDSSNRVSVKPRARRKSLESLLEPNTLFGGHSLSFNRQALEALREEQERKAALSRQP